MLGSYRQVIKSEPKVRTNTILQEKRIAIFLPSLVGGGAERVMVNLTEGFLERGYHVDLVLAKAEGPYLKSLPESVSVFDCNASSVLKSLNGLRKYLQTYKPKTLYTALGHSNITAVVAKKLARVKTKVVISVHNVTPPRLSRFSKEQVLQQIFPIFYRHADEIVAVAKAVADDVVQKARLAPKDVTVIYNPVISQDIFTKAKEDVPLDWFDKGQPPVFVGVGRLTEQKDFSTLIWAFSEFRKKHQARLLILGEGEARAELEALVKQLGLQEDVLMPGFVDNPYAYISKANAFVLSSIYEGLPTVLIEALALGTPVISTNCVSGPKEILNNGEYGSIVPMKNPVALSRAMEDSIQKPREAAVKEAYRPFLREVATDNYLQVGGLV